MAVHDRGGMPAGPIDRSEHDLADWESLTDAMNFSLGRRRIYTVDEHRRAIESLPRDQYESLPYYGRWLVALEALLIEKGLLTKEELDRKVASLRD